MMNRSIRIASTLVLVSAIFSCRKPSKSDDDKNTGDVSTLLSKVMIWNTTEPRKNILIVEFKYDDLLRVTEIAYSAGDSVNGTIQANAVRTKKSYYHGNDKNPYKTTGFILPLGYPSGDVYHYYNNSGVLTADSTGTWRVYNGYYKRELAWSSDKVIITNTDTYSGSVEQTKDSLVIDGNNITEGYISNSMAYLVQNYKYKYDNKINPLTKLNIAAFTIVDGMDGYLAPGYSKNNITEITRGARSNSTGPFTTTSTSLLTYTYNDEGLPTELRSSGSVTKYYYRED